MTKLRQNLFVFIRECRPKQWIKNSLVLVAPLTSKKLFEYSTLKNAALILCSMCAVSSATYFINDLRDRDADARHPKKRNRPIASGQLSVRAAYIDAIALFLLGMALASLVTAKALVVVCLYLVTTTAYSIFLKRVPVVEIFIVASGFVLRAYVGAVAADVPPSSWFLVSILAGSLFVATRKRYAELTGAQDTERDTRKVLSFYSKTSLSRTSRLFGALFVLAYIGWCVEVGPLGSIATVLRLVSAVPLGAAVLRYEKQSEGQLGESPEDLLTEDRAMKVWGAIWFVCVAVSLYIA